MLVVSTPSSIELTAPERKETCHPFLGNPEGNFLEEKKIYTLYFNYRKVLKSFSFFIEHPLI